MSLFKKISKQKYLKVSQDFFALKEKKMMYKGDLILVSNDIALAVNNDRQKEFKNKKINNKPIVEEIEL